ncbi:MAG: Gfo/Idh/MocA family oxidoreductase [Bacteroidota bacterium]|nr:Gfo/Idh/MocA family oxidoreductase [Bacteroidota bacterium]
MSSNRRDFLRKTIIGAGLVTTGLSGISATLEKSGITKTLAGSDPRDSKKHVSRFNMSGYCAPKLNVVRMGIIGLGDRGSGAVARMSYIDGVEIKALADKREAAVKTSQSYLSGFGISKAAEYFGSEDVWKKMCERNDIDLIYICTPWALHTPMALYAMEHGKHVAVEVPAAKTLEECWQLVETSERTRKHCMMLENCCYDFFELLTLNMARQGLFGELVHGEGAYLHNLLDMNFAKPADQQQTDGAYTDMWRLKENFRNGNIYPTHGLGPICQAMNVNRGDKMEYLTSMSSADFQMAAKAKELAAKDPFYNQFAGKSYRGNMNTSIIRTHKGRTIMIQHDVTSTQPYSRIHLLKGTKGLAQKWPSPERISFSHEWLSDAEMKKLYDQYTPPIARKMGDMAKRVGGHGGMDFLMDWRLIDCLRNGLALDQDVYDAALWSSISPLSEWSVANRSNSIDVPDFTCGAWKTNKPVELSLNGGGNTEVKELTKTGAAKQLEVH